MVPTSVHEQCWESTASLEKIQKCIRNGHDIMILMRGVPGSGKTHLASELLSGTSGAIFSTDNYFMDNGVYQFDRTKLEAYHQKNLKEAKDAMQKGVKPIIIDNTNIFMLHMKPYILQAVKNSYEIYFVEPETAWKRNAKQCAWRNVHSIPEDKIAYLIENYEKVTLSEVIKPMELRINPPLFDDSDDDDDYLELSSNNVSSLTSGVWRCTYLEYPEKSQNSLTDGGASSSTAFLQSCEQDTQLEDAMRAFSTGTTLGNVTEKKSEPLFSLLPPPELLSVKKKTGYTVGCQTSSLIRLFELSESLSDASGEFLVKSVEHELPPYTGNKKPKEKAVQTDDDFVPNEVDLLLALFPDESAADLLHLWETCGVHNTIKLMEEMNARMNIYAPVVRSDRLSWAQPLSASFDCSWADGESEDGQVADGSSSRSSLKIERKSRKKSRNLAPCSHKQTYGVEPVRHGCLRMELSVDMMKQLSELFGDGEETNTNTYVDLPLSQWYQIYQYWQGISVTDEGEGEHAYDSFVSNFPSASSPDSDEELARMLQDEELYSISPPETCKHWCTASHLQLSALYEAYPGVDRERIAECFCDNKYSAEATRRTLNLFVYGIESSDVIVPTTSEGSKMESSGRPATPSTSRCVVDDLWVSRPNLEEAHQKALDLWNEALSYYSRKKKLLERIPFQREPSVKAFYAQEAQKYDRKARECLKEKNEILINANTATFLVDLHYMDVSSALNLLKMKLNAVARLLSLQHGSSEKQFVVLTGYGKSNGGHGKIRSAVINFLRSGNYKFDTSKNKGVIVVDCK